MTKTARPMLCVLFFWWACARGNWGLPPSLFFSLLPAGDPKKKNGRARTQERRARPFFLSAHQLIPSAVFCFFLIFSKNSFVSISPCGARAHQEKRGEMRDRH
nr:hypothetical protein [Pandoravirus belohorizontensis]